MVFQDPMTSFNPVYRIGDQIVEAIRAHRGEIEQGRGARAGGRAARLGRHPRRRAARRRLPARILRRHAPAGDDRDGAGAGAGGADRRRADHGARRDDPGADPAPARGPQPRARPGDDPDHPRPRRGRRGRRPGAGDVRRAGGRGGDARRDLLRPPAPLHLGPARVADPARPAAAEAAAADQRRAAVAARAAGGLRLPAPLPARVRPLRRAARPRGAPRRCARPPRPLLARPRAEARAAPGRGPDRAGGAGR